MDLELMGKGFLQNINDYGNLQAERTKLKTGLLVNSLKAKQNLIYKLQEKQLEQQMQYDWFKKMQQMYAGQEGNTNPEGDVFSQEVTPQVRWGGSGPTLNYPSRTEFIAGRIALKKRRGMPLSDQEQTFENKYYFGTMPREEQFDTALRKAKNGEMTWDELTEAYPSKRKQIEDFRQSTLPKLSRSPDFRMGRGLPAYFSKNIANINEKTMKVIDQIENMEDLKELIERREEAKVKGIDVDAILEYFGKSEEEVNASEF